MGDEHGLNRRSLEVGGNQLGEVAGVIEEEQMVRMEAAQGQVWGGGVPEWWVRRGILKELRNYREWPQGTVSHKSFLLGERGDRGIKRFSKGRLTLLVEVEDRN